MNLSEQLMADMSRRNIDYIAHYIGNDPQLFENLMEIIFSGKSPLPFRAAWVVTAVTDKHPQLLLPYSKKIIGQLERFDHTGIRRNFLRYFSEHDIPSSSEGKLYDICYRWMLARKEPPAIKVYSMQIMFNISKREPDLKNELKLLLEELVNHESAAIKSRSRQLMAKL